MANKFLLFYMFDERGMVALVLSLSDHWIRLIDI